MILHLPTTTLSSGKHAYASTCIAYLMALSTNPAIAVRQARPYQHSLRVLSLLLSGLSMLLMWPSSDSLGSTPRLCHHQRLRKRRLPLDHADSRWERIWQRARDAGVWHDRPGLEWGLSGAWADCGILAQRVWWRGGWAEGVSTGSGLCRVDGCGRGWVSANDAAVDGEETVGEGVDTMEQYRCWRSSKKSIETGSYTYTYKDVRVFMMLKHAKRPTGTFHVR